MVNAIIIAPNTTNGERSSSLNVRLSPVCTFSASAVILVIIVDVPSSSMSVYEKPCMCENRALLILVPKPTAAFAQKYCAVTEKASPTAPSKSRISEYFTILPVSPLLIPWSII